MNSTDISVLSLLTSSIIVFWFAIIAVIKTKRKGPFFPFFVSFSLICFIAAGLFTGANLGELNIFIYILSMVIGITYLFFIWRENK